MEIVRTKDLSYTYTRNDDEGNPAEVIQALRGIDVEILRGQFVAILGHNGSGKSTLAKHINALLFPNEGTIWVGGMDTRDEDHLWEIRQTAGMVFQNPDNQIIATVVEEDVGFGPENMGVPTEEIWSRVDRALKAVGMTKFAKTSPNHLSGGQKQRIAIAGAMAMLPKCIILDEATAMLDPQGREEVMSTIRRLNKEAGMTVISITHYMEEAVDCDRVLVMDKGRVVMDGTPREIFSRGEELRALELSVPQVTELADALRADGLDIPAGILTDDELVEALCRLN